MRKTPNIAINQAVRFGKPVIAGTRVAVEDVLLLLESGYCLDEIPKQYPALTLQDTKKAIAYAAQVLGKEEVLSIS